MFIKAYAEPRSGRASGGSSEVNGALRAGVNNTGKVLTATIGRYTYTWQPGDTIYNPGQLRGLLKVQETGAVMPSVSSAGRSRGSTIGSFSRGRARGR